MRYLAAIVASVVMLALAHHHGYNQAQAECELKISTLANDNLTQIMAQAEGYNAVAKDYKARLDAANVAASKRLQPTADKNTVPAADYRQLAARYDAAGTQYRECAYRLRAWQDLHK